MTVDYHSAAFHLGYNHGRAGLQPCPPNHPADPRPHVHADIRSYVEGHITGAAEQDWLPDLEHLDDDDDRAAAEVLDPNTRARLLTAYRRPPRHYHNHQHAQTVARHVVALGGDRACLLAAWFHDVIYQPGAPDNEQQSARLLETWLPDDPDTAHASQLITMTADHQPDPDDWQAAILADADLAILGTDPLAYLRYQRAVRSEYARYDDTAWRTGRAAVLTSLLERDPLYHTAQGQRLWQSQAHANMRAELAQLRNS